MTVMALEPKRLGPFALAFAVGALVAAVVTAVATSGSTGAVADPPRSPAPTGSASAAPSPSASPGELLKIGGLPGASPIPTVDPLLLPYPYMSPTPPPTPTVLDGTYIRTLTLRDVGGARIGLPGRCLRCPPYRLDAGVSTIIFHEGAYFLDHQISRFRTQGSFVVEGDRLTLFNDPNCPQMPGVYGFELTDRALRLRVIDDDCPWSGERARDLTRTPWAPVSACVRWIEHLWPGPVAC